MSDPTVISVPGTPIASGALITPGGGQGYTGSTGPVGPAGPSGSTTWAGISGKPSVFPPSAHTHVETDVTNLVADLNNRVLITTAVTGTNSLTGGGPLSASASLSLVNDVASPGASRFYATNVSNVRGWIAYGTAALVNVPSSGNATNAQAVLGSDTRLADSRSPKAHAASHGSGGSDQVSLLRAQIADLPGVVNTTSMGFAPALPTVNPTTVYFRGDGSYSPVTVSGSSIFVPWSNIVGAPLATVGAPGLLRQLNPATPVPGSGSATQVWCRGDDSWQVLPVTTYTNATFTIPVLGASTTVAVNPSPEWPQVTSCAYFSDGTTRGFLECSATGTGPYASVTLTNRGFALNATPGTLVNQGAILSLKGPSIVLGSSTGLVPTLPASTPSSRYLDGTGSWSVPAGSGISDAPSDGNTYARKNAAWTSIAASGGMLDRTTAVEYFDDFISYLTGNGPFPKLGWVLVNYSGSGASITNQATWGPSGGALGVWNLNTQTSTGGLAGLTLGPSTNGWTIAQYNCGAVIIEWRINLQALETSANYAEWKFGINGQPAGSEYNAMYFRYNVVTSPNWFCCAYNSSLVAQDSGVVAATGWLKLTITINSTWTQAIFAINGTTCATMTIGGFPGGSGWSPMVSSALKAGSQQSIMLDWFYAKISFSRP